MNYSVGDVVFMKKSHPCGNNEFKILRVGTDFKLKCCNCDRLIILSRAKFLKLVKLGI